VTQGTSSTLRLIAGLVIVLDLALFGLLVALWSRLRRTQAALLEAQSNGGTQGRSP
jgi:hypothetical protein